MKAYAIWSSDKKHLLHITTDKKLVDNEAEFGYHIVPFEAPEPLKPIIRYQIFSWRIEGSFENVIRRANLYTKKDDAVADLEIHKLNEPEFNHTIVEVTLNA